MALTDSEEKNRRRVKSGRTLTVLPSLTRGERVHYEIYGEDDKSK
jgi:hypothetical protein